eukprot:g44186.t1
MAGLPVGLSARLDSPRAPWPTWRKESRSRESTGRVSQQSEYRPSLTAEQAWAESHSRASTGRVSQQSEHGPSLTAERAQAES